MFLHCSMFTINFSQKSVRSIFERTKLIANTSYQNAVAGISVRVNLSNKYQIYWRLMSFSTVSLAVSLLIIFTSGKKQVKGFLVFGIQIILGLHFNSSKFVKILQSFQLTYKSYSEAIWTLCQPCYQRKNVPNDKF